ncbi:MAG: (2Fe-2S)-binding protein [Chromatiales bacterium]|nr:(2Fe-2S)-binding protein [Gammaproteobacteria bacterium]MBW6477196.1 (2Fe-2S)-binding protein [Chromatiales bacterium]
MSQGLQRATEINTQTRAGSNCGSCMPEITQILRQQIERP